MANTHVQGMSGKRESMRETEKGVGRRPGKCGTLCQEVRNVYTGKDWVSRKGSMFGRKNSKFHIAYTDLDVEQ